MSYYNFSLPKALLELFPNIGLERSKFGYVIPFLIPIFSSSPTQNVMFPLLTSWIDNLLPVRLNYSRPASVYESTIMMDDPRYNLC